MVFIIFSGLFFEKHLKYIKLNEQFVPFTKMNLSYLLKVRKYISTFNAKYMYDADRFPQDNYDIAFVNDVYQSTVVSYSELKSGNIVAPGPVRIPYYTRQSFKNTSKLLGLMDDFRVMHLFGEIRTPVGSVLFLKIFRYARCCRAVYPDLDIVAWSRFSTTDDACI